MLTFRQILYHILITYTLWLERMLLWKQKDCWVYKTENEKSIKNML